MTRTRLRYLWSLATVLLICMLLRPPLAGVGPLLNQIQAQYQLNSAQLGFLTSAPVLCFGIGAFAGPSFVRWLGLSRAFTVILVALTLLILVRGTLGFAFLLGATILLGLAIAVSNVLFPTLVRVEFPNQVAKMTAVYTTALSAFSAVASGVSVPLAGLLGSWQASLAVWAIPGALALFAWIQASRYGVEVAPTTSVATPAKVWSSGLAWALAAFFGLQSANFYILLNWLPTILVSKGLSPLDAGATLGVVSMVGIPVGLVMTANLQRFKSLTLLVVAISAVTAGGVALFAAPNQYLPVAVVLTGVGLSSSFPLALALMALKSKTEQSTTSLSSMSQGVGYLLAALGVFVAGLSFQIFHSWMAALGLQIAMSLVQAFAGIYAARHQAI